MHLKFEYMVLHPNDVFQWKQANNLIGYYDNMLMLYFTKLGEEGWELVCIMNPQSDRERFEYMFKRQKISESYRT